MDRGASDEPTKAREGNQGDRPIFDAAYAAIALYALAYADPYWRTVTPPSAYRDLTRAKRLESSNP